MTEVGDYYVNGMATSTDETDLAAVQPHYRKLEEGRMTADEMDLQRLQNIAYEYLCHLEEAKVWIEACINEELPPTTELEVGLQNGVFLAKLANFFDPDHVPLKKIYDKDQTRYNARGLHFRHTDNVMQWLRAMDIIGLPKIFYPEVTDIYDRKNMPRAIYCLHALSLYLFKLGLAPQIQDLYGKVEFTEEEISAMRKELEKYGIQMPAFSKIGGILANEMTVDDAALHAAVIAINEAVERGDAGETMAAMQNPAAMLNNLQADYSSQYQDLLYGAKSAKLEISQNKSIDPDYEPDVYDELLTQAEIQGNVNKVNTSRALQKLSEALDRQDEGQLLTCLTSSHLNLKNVTPDNVAFYMSHLISARDMKRESSNSEAELDKDDVQQCMEAANKQATAERQKIKILELINAAVAEQNEEALMKHLQNPASQLPAIHAQSGPLYLVEFTSMQKEKEGQLDYNEVFTAASILLAVALVNEAIDKGNAGDTFKALCHPDTHIDDLDEGTAPRYHNQLHTAKQAKHRMSCPFLTHNEIFYTVELVNQQVQEEQERIMALTTINEAIDKGDSELTLVTLQQPAAQLTGVNANEAVLYQSVLLKEKKNKASAAAEEEAALWLDEIQSCLDRANKNAEDSLKLSQTVYLVNQSIAADDPQSLLTYLSSPDIYLHSVTPECSQLYLDKLTEEKKNKELSGEVGSGWMMNRIKDGHKFYYNVHSQKYSWERQADITKDFSLLTRDEIQNVVSEVTAAYDRELLFKSNEPIITKIQATWRGYQARMAYKDRMDFMKNQLPAIIKIQSWVRGLKQKRLYNSRLEFLHRSVDPTVKIQSVVRMWLARRAFKKRLGFFSDNEEYIIKMQAFVRSALAKQDYKSLMHEKNPPLSVVRKFVHLLDASDVDYAEELELQKLRQHVVTEIRSNQTLEQDLNIMDIKIGLLIKNRITLQDVVFHHRKLAKQIDQSGAIPKGLKALSHESRQKLEAYQHLFYQLQTNPAYMAKLIFEIPQVKTTKFIESVVFSLFNYGSNPREEYLLLRLFTAALKEEISSKVDKMTDIVTGNPLVVKMIVSYNRNQRGQNALRELLNPLILEVLNDKDLKINTNPVDVYKDWVNQKETTTGEASGLPYEVTSEQALENNEVRDIIDKYIEQLKLYTEKFLSALLVASNKIPYSMRYMAHVMRQTLWEKFPISPERDILKIVGNLLYYRYINPAIVAPEAFDIIEVSVEKMMSSDQRRNLGSIAKILQFVASNKGFGTDSPHLVCLNTYIRESHDKFKAFFRTCCDVQEPEIQYNVDRYTDVTMVTKPVIYMSIQEICDTHQLLLQHQDIIAPDHNDPLHELLEDLGDGTPSVLSLVGNDHVGTEELDETVKTQLGKTEISLTLTNKFEVPTTDSSDIKAILIKTKRLIIDVVACQPGDSLTQVLNTPATEEQEHYHKALISKRDRIDRKAVEAYDEGKELVRQPSIHGETRLLLDEMKVIVRQNLEKLEAAGSVKSSDDYQDITNLIVQDIRNQRHYRNNRKQELSKLKQTYKGLLSKRAFFEEQIDYYNKYVKKCLDNLQKRANRKSRGFGFFKREGEKHKETVKYSAQRLHEKGIVLEIEGLSQNRFKDCMFEISSTEEPGVFDVNAKFLGVETHKVEIIFQDLLQLQYQGVAVMKMFDSAKVNVNLLIFLINKKFYGK